MAQLWYSKDEALKLAMQQLQTLTNAFMPSQEWIGTELFNSTEEIYKICEVSLDVCGTCDCMDCECGEYE